jgi:hypothetical protein
MLSQKEKLLLLIERNKLKGISEIGRQVYSTNKSCYDVIYEFQNKGFIEIISIKNKLVPVLTLIGQEEVDNIKEKLLFDS